MVKQENHSLLYFGAGWDFKPISDPTYTKFNHFIFIDALPKIPHYEPGMRGYEKSKDETSFINTLKKTATQYGLKFIRKNKNLLVFKNDKIKLEYYINTTVEESLNNKTIRNKLNKVKWMHMEGFNPYEYGLKIGDLHNKLEYRAKIKEL